MQIILTHFTQMSAQTLSLFLCRSMLPVQPTGPAISLELDVDDGEVENYEVCHLLSVCFLSLFD